MGELLALKKIETHYGPIRILKGVDIAVGEGEVVALLGGNAAGKSTTMKTILGLVTPSSGRVHFAGRDVTARQTVPPPSAPGGRCRAACSPPCRCSTI